LTSEKQFSESVENHLKIIYRLSLGDEGASNQKIAASLGITGAGVTKMLNHLSKLGLITYSPYHPARLTPIGEKIALELIRHHRLLELYLMESLGYGWEHVHAEAERLEHYISEEFEDKIERLLGFPQFDPHGDPIPTRDGIVAPLAMNTLSSQEDGSLVVVRRVSDNDSDLLSYLGERNLRPGIVVRLLGREPFGGSLLVNIEDREARISLVAACNVFVEPLVSLADCLATT
jgi:DtxR family Mn-dependent transcriptional regulator